MVVPLHRVNVWADLGRFSSVLVNLLCPLHNPFRDTSVSDANQTNPPNKNAVNSLLTPWSPRNYTGITGITLMFLITRLCTTIARVWTRTFVCIIIDYHRLSSAIIKAETTVDYHQLWWSFQQGSKVCWEPSDEALFEYHRTHSIRAFKLLFN